MNWLLRKIVKRLIKWSDKTNRTHYINGGPRGETVYLVRYIIFKSKWFSIFIHRFMRSDGSDPHDHPWNFLAYMLEGKYTEKYYDMEKPQISSNKEVFLSFWTEKINYRKVGSLAYRKSNDIHRVELERSYIMSEIEQAPLTICFIGKRIRQWGFWPKDDNGARFVHWRHYLSITPKDPRAEGSE